MHNISFISPGKAWLAAGILLAVLSGCSSGPVIDIHRDRGPAPGSVDVSGVPDAVPRVEPRSKYGNPASYVVNGQRYYVMTTSQGYLESGIASWYGEKFHGRRTSSGETYDMYAMTAAHKSLPLPTYAQVRNLENGRIVVVKVNDRGPFHGNRIIDLSYTAAAKLDILGKGTGLVEVRALDPVTYAQTDPSSSTQVPVRSAVTGLNINGKLGFYIQVGAFSDILNARKLQDRLGPLTGDLVKITQANVRGNSLYRVRIGPIVDVSFADEIVSSLGAYGVTQHHITVD